jgi:uncharacterized protein
VRVTKRTRIRIGVISDTHGLARPQALAALTGVDRIIHAGDIGSPAILDQLTSIAPVTAVCGNVDRDAWARSLPETALLECGPVLIYVIHDVQRIDLDPAAAGISVVVCGHSHIPGEIRRNGVLYFNPGSAGPRRFMLPVSLGYMIISGDQISAETVTLDA